MLTDLIILTLKVDEVVQKVPILGCARGIALDIIFGPEDEFGYVSKTAPTTPPPSESSD